MIYEAKIWVRQSVACREGISTLQRLSQGRLPLIECAISNMTLKLLIHPKGLLRQEKKEIKDFNFCGRPEKLPKYWTNGHIT